MRIRLHGTPTEIAATVTALRRILEIQDESRPYPDGQPATLTRLYLEAEPRESRKESN